MSPLRWHVLSIAMLCASGWMSACSDPAAYAAPQSSPPLPADAKLVDATISEASRELLRIAFEAASAIPEYPHIKARSRSQDRVIATCLQLDLPATAARLLASVQGWRRGALHADLADWCARHNQQAEALRHLEQAEAFIGSSVANAGDQEWRRERVRSKMARAYLALGREEDSARLLSELSTSEQGVVAIARVQSLDERDFDAQLQEIDRMFATGDFDQSRLGLELCAALHERFASNEPRMDLLELRVDSAASKLPVDLRIRALQSMAENAIQHEQFERAQRLLTQAQNLVDTVRWQLVDELRLRSCLAALQARSGSKEVAQQALLALRARFDREGSSIVDIYRAGALRAIAAAEHSVTDAENALKTHALATEAGLINPNSLPRAEDLIESCCSMATAGLLPSASYLARLEEIREGLGAPW